MSTSIDLTRPNEGRIIDCWLGGTHNFEVDRLAAERFASYLSQWGLADAEITLGLLLGYAMVLYK